MGGNSLHDFLPYFDLRSKVLYITVAMDIQQYLQSNRNFHISLIVNQIYIYTVYKYKIIYIYIYRASIRRCYTFEIVVKLSIHNYMGKWGYVYGKPKYQPFI